MTPTSYSESELMSRVASGDAHALGVLYDSYGHLVVRYIYRVTGDYEAAEDLCQEVFLVVAAKAAKYEHRGFLKSWIFGIATHKARGYNRKLWARRKLLRQNIQLLEPEVPHEPSPREQAVRRAFLQLSSKDREILSLQVSEGFSGEEIAEALNINHNAVRVRLYRARKQLKKLIEHELKSGATQ